MSDIPPPPPGAMPPPPPPPPSGGVPPLPPLGASPPSGYQVYPASAQGYDQPKQYAGFGARLGAFIIDGLIAILFELPGIIVLFAGPKHVVSCTVNDQQGFCNVPTGPTIGLAVLLFLAGIITFLVMFCRRISRSQSWGMKAAGITVVDSERGQRITAGRAFGWYIAHVLSQFFCYLGYLWMLWDKRNQTWHDKIAGTVVIKV